MKRLYYVADDLGTTRQVADAMRDMHIDDVHFHVVSRDEAGLTHHGIHAATTYQQLDIVHLGARFALLGGVLGVPAGLLLMRIVPFHPQFAWPMVGAVTLLFAMFGAWQGGMLGLSRENYKIARFHVALAGGKHLLMIDVDPANEARIRNKMIARFASVLPGGSGTTLVNPFASSGAAFAQNTH